MRTIRAKKRFGQHFLVDQSVLMQITQAIGLSENDRCIEIGPGKGALTKYLLSTPAQIHAIEIDHRLEETLNRWKSEHPRFSFTMGDVLEVGITGFFPEGQQLTVVGNLPYEISTPLLFALVPERDMISQLVFLLQKEVVDRISAKVNTSQYGRLSVMMQYYFQVDALLVVPPEAFSPPPKVMSQVVRLTPIHREWVDPKEFEAFVKYLFAQKRKMLRQRFKAFMSTEEWNGVGVQPTSRAQEIDLDKILVLFEYFNSKGISWL